METRVELTPLERTKRFWEAHGYSVDHLTLLHAFADNQEVDWTIEGLCHWYGLGIDRVRAIVEEFAECGIVGLIPGRIVRFRWNAHQDWAIPRDAAGREVVEKQWAWRS